MPLTSRRICADMGSGGATVWWDQFMSKRHAVELLKPDEYLACYDMPRMSGLWGVLIAPSIEAIQVKYPELAIADELPMWMSEASLTRMRETPLWLDDDPPQGLLNALVADRERE